VHSLRHTCGTALIAEGVDPVSAASILGHSTPSTTLDIYAHVVESAKVAAIAKIGNYLGRRKDVR